MTVQIAGGIGMQYPRTALGVDRSRRRLFAFLAGLHPGIIAAPAIYVHYGSFFEQSSSLCGAIALYAATEANEARAVAFGRVARLGLGVCAISFTLSQMLYFL